MGFDDRPGGGAQAPPQPVAAHRRAGPDNSEGGARDGQAVAHRTKPEAAAANVDAVRTQCSEAAPPAQAVPPVHRGPVGVRRLRPLRRRALRTCRPPGVDIRMRNPCVLRR